MNPLAIIICTFFVCLTLETIVVTYLETNSKEVIVCSEN